MSIFEHLFDATSKNYRFSTHIIQWVKLFILMCINILIIWIIQKSIYTEFEIKTYRKIYFQSKSFYKFLYKIISNVTAVQHFLPFQTFQNLIKWIYFSSSYFMAYSYSAFISLKNLSFSTIHYNLSGTQQMTSTHSK